MLFKKFWHTKATVCLSDGKAPEPE